MKTYKYITFQLIELALKEQKHNITEVCTFICENGNFIKRNIMILSVKKYLKKRGLVLLHTERVGYLMKFVIYNATFCS